MHNVLPLRINKACLQGAPVLGFAGGVCFQDAQYTTQPVVVPCCMPKWAHHLQGQLLCYESGMESLHRLSWGNVGETRVGARRAASLCRSISLAVVASAPQLGDERPFDLALTLMLETVVQGRFWCAVVV